MDCHVVLRTPRNDVVTAGGVAGVTPAERVAEDREAGWSEGETSPSFIKIYAPKKKSEKKM